MRCSKFNLKFNTAFITALSLIHVVFLGLQDAAEAMMFSKSLCFHRTAGFVWV